MKKKGLTLIELIVAMTLFVVVATLAIGGFVSITKVKILVSSMKNSQQKIRIANEMITRYAKQAEAISLDPSGNWIEMYFDVGDTNDSARKFVLSGSSSYDLLYYECASASLTQTTCSNWGTGTSLLGSSVGSGGTVSIANSGIFSLNANYPSVLNVMMTVQSAMPNFSYFNNSITIENAVIMESLK